MHYSGLELDRAGDRRADPAWIAGLTARPGARVVPLWRDRCLVQAGSPVETTGRAGQALLDAAPEPVFLGLDAGQAVFAVDLSELAEGAALARADAEDMQDIRVMVPTLTPAKAGVLAYARGLLHWHRNQRFCGACGGVADSRDGGHLRVCRGCAKLLFPRIEPAVIVLVEDDREPRRCLLGRHAGAGPDNFSTLAGFVEIGESLEDAVRREVFEEAGVVVKNVGYQGSQAWPFPAGLMVAFRAEAVSDETEVDGAELIEARWFTTAELRDHIDAGNSCRPDSIDKFLIENWIAQGAGHPTPTSRSAV